MLASLNRLPNVNYKLSNLNYNMAQADSIQ